MIVFIQKLLLAVAFAQSSALLLNWEDAAQESISIRGVVDTELVEKCVSSGLRVEYRFLLRMCRRRSNWFDSCDPIQKQIHHIDYEPVTRSFRVSVDRLRDDRPQERHTFGKFSEALEALVEVENLRLLFLSGDFPAGESHSDKERQRYIGNHYVGIRTIATCQGEYSETLTRVSYLLTLGLIDLGGEDSGWRDVPLSSLN